MGERIQPGTNGPRADGFPKLKRYSRTQPYSIPSYPPASRFLFSPKRILFRQREIDDKEELFSVTDDFFKYAVGESSYCLVCSTKGKISRHQAFVAIGFDSGKEGGFGGFTTRGTA